MGGFVLDSLGALAFGRGDLLLGLAGHGVGLVVLLAVVAGLLPQLLALLQLLLRPRPDRSRRDAARSRPGSSPAPAAPRRSPRRRRILVAGGAAVQPHLACAQLRQQRSVRRTAPPGSPTSTAAPPPPPSHPAARGPALPAAPSTAPNVVSQLQPSSLRVECVCYMRSLLTPSASSSPRLRARLRCRPSGRRPARGCRRACLR